MTDYEVAGSIRTFAFSRFNDRPIMELEKEVTVTTITSMALYIQYHHDLGTLFTYITK